MTHLRVQITRKYFEKTGVLALQNLSFEVAANDIVAIVGPSGAGKSTLLNIIGGLDPEFGGELCFDDRSSEQPAPRIGFVFQSARLMPWLSVFDNIRLVLDDNDQGLVKTRQVLERVGLTEFEDAFPSQLSGGMQRRVALARAFAIEPEILLLDEPFMSLDLPTATQQREWLLALWELRHPTVLLVTHDFREALVLANRILFFSGRPGNIVLDYHVPLPRPRDLNDPELAAVHEGLLNQHPQLLSGLAEEATGEQGSTPYNLGEPGSADQ